MKAIDIKKELKSCLLFKELSEDDIDKIATISSVRTMSKRNLIFSEGDEPEGFYMVIKGAVKLFHLTLDGKEEMIKLIQQGETFADKSCFSGEQHPCFAETKKLSLLIYVPIFQFNSILYENPSIKHKLFSFFSKL
jgi:CRP-like cAMP-binding protein